MKTTKQVLKIMCLFFFQTGIYAQISQPPVASLSPNAASLGLYGDIPVSLYTGTPDISISLYDITVKDFVLPISLSYHASGVQVDQIAGWTGVNWTLFAGGVISRTINDKPDDYHNPNYYQGGNSGFYFNYNVLNTNSWNQRAYLRTVAQSDQSLKDNAPDEFSFSFPGYSGKFYLDHTRNWVVQCDKPVKLEFDGTFLQIPFDKQGTRAANYGYAPCFSGFVITTEEGTKYQFGKNINAIDFSIDFFNQYYADWLATSWYLTKIILPNTHEINFTYERDEFNCQMYIAVRHEISSSTESSGGIFSLDPVCSAWSFPPIDYCYEGKLIAPVYLKEITTDLTVVSFNKNISLELKYDAQSICYRKYEFWKDYLQQQYQFLPILKSGLYGFPSCLTQLQWYKLVNITVQNKNKTETLKTIDFSYYSSTTPERLFLQKVKESGKSPYEFSYFNKENLPDYLANRSDHWGYFNNTYANLSYSNYYNYRNPNPTVSKYGILTKIIYPTGGYTEFEYEPHYYRKQLNIERWNPCSTLSSNQIAGGLRVKQIKNSATPQGPSLIVKEYYYVSDYLQNNTNASVSSGVLGGQIQYYFTDYTVYSFNNNNTRRKLSIFSSISVLPSCQNTNGSHIGYTEVIEKYPDNSFTRYQFSNFDNGYLDESSDAIIQQSRTPYERYASKASERGRLLLQETYNVDRKKIKSKSIDYEKDVSSNNFVRAMEARYSNVCPNTAVSYDEGVSYKIYTYLLCPKAETETYYDPVSTTTWQTTITNYAYTDKKLIRSISVTNSDGAILKTEYKYPFDISGNTVLNQMINNNILSRVVEQSEYKNNQFLTKTNTEYKNWGNNLIEPEIIKLQSTQGGQLENRITYHNRDSRGNPLYIVKDTADPVVYLWGYNYQYPVAEIKGATFSEVTIYISSSTLNTIAAKNEPSSTDWDLINGLRSSLPKALVTTFTYQPLVGMRTMTDPRNVVTQYDYDPFGRLKKVTRAGRVVDEYTYNYRN